MELHEMELEDAARRLAAHGRDRNDFAFEISFLPPDPDSAGMYTVRYEVKITGKASAKSLVAVGGIGLRWVDDFERALKDGYFD